MNKKIAMFDMDGTVLNTFEDIVNATNYVLEKFGLPKRSREEMKFNVGYGAYRQIEGSVPSGTPKELIDKIYEFYLPYYNEHSLIETKPYDGIVKVMEEIRKSGLKVAIISNKPNPTVQLLKDKFFSKACDISIGAMDGLNIKPSSDMINKILAEYNLDAKDSVYIGDTEVDIATAVNSNMDMIVVTWGFRDVDFLKSNGGKNFVNSPEEILKVLEVK